MWRMKWRQVIHLIPKVHEILCMCTCVGAPVWKGSRVFHEYLWITRAFSPMISADAVEKLYAEVLHDTQRRHTGIQFTLSLTAEGDDRTQQ